MTETDRAELERLGSDEIAKSNWFAHRALVLSERTVAGPAGRLPEGGSWLLLEVEPGPRALAQAAYSIAYVPVAVLGGIGMVFAWRNREVVLIGMLFLAFMCVTAVFWAHTSHRSYLDVYWIVFAASVIETFRARVAGREIPARAGAPDGTAVPGRPSKASARRALFA